MPECILRFHTELRGEHFRCEGRARILTHALTMLCFQNPFQAVMIAASLACVKSAWMPNSTKMLTKRLFKGN